MERNQGRLKIPPKNGIPREIFRDIAHPFIFRVESQDPDGGLLKLQQGLQNGIGGVIVSTHFSEVDPAWIMNAVTRKNGLRNTAIIQPIASDRTYGGKILKLTRATGVTLVPVVTPDAVERAKKRGEKAEQGQGLGEYLKKAAEVLQNGGIVSMPYTATRKPYLVSDENDALSYFMMGMKRFKVENYNIHFAAPELPGVEDYDTKRKFNFFMPHIIHHGETYSAAELLKKAKVSDPSISETKHESDAYRNMGKLAYEEFNKIVPAGYLPKM